MSSAPTLEGEPKKYTIGTLVYTKAGLCMLFIWLLWGDFCFTAMEMVGGGGILSLYLFKKLGANNFQATIMLTAIPQLIGVVLGPIISFKSDRYRSKWGRRIPFMAMTAPFLCMFLIGLGFSDNIAIYFKEQSSIPALLHIDPITITFIIIGFMVIGFSFFNEFVNTVWWYLYADVVPKEFLGRFLALFRIVGMIPGMLFGWFLNKYQLSHMHVIFIAAAALYFFGFGLMCLGVKEGKYPAVIDVTEKTTLWDKIQLYFRECFTHPIYVFTYLGTVATAIGASAGGGGGLFLLQLGQHKTTYSGHQGYVSAVVIQPDGKGFISAGHDKTVRIWETDKDNPISVLTGHTEKINCMAMTPDGKTAITAGSDNSIRIWDVLAKKCDKVIPCADGEFLSMALSPDKKTVITSSRLLAPETGYSVKLWDINAGKMIRQLGPIYKNTINAVAFSPKGDNAAIGDGKDIKVFSVATGDVLKTLSDDDSLAEQKKWPKMEEITSLAFMPAISASEENVKKKDEGWVQLSLREFANMGRDIKEVFADDSIFKFNPAKSPKEKEGVWIASGGKDKALRIWDMGTGKCIKVMKGCKEPIDSIQYKPDLHMLITGSMDKSMQMAIWDASDVSNIAIDNSLKSFTGYSTNCTNFSAQSEGKLAVTATREGDIHLWNLDNGVSLDRSGKVRSLVTVLTFLLSFPFGWLVDKFHPVRMAFLTSLAIAPVHFLWCFLLHDYYSFLIMEVLKATIFCLMSAATFPMLITIFPGDKYGQFCSANGLCNQFFRFAMSFFGAWLFDKITHDALLTDNFRYGAAWNGAFMTLNVLCIYVVYRNWKKLGGDKGYVPPEPYKKHLPESA